MQTVVLLKNLTQYSSISSNSFLKAKPDKKQLIIVSLVGSVSISRVIIPACSSSSANVFNELLNNRLQQEACKTRN